MIEIIQWIFTVFFLLVGAWVCWESSVMISERNNRRRKGITDYYDNPIKKEKDETVS